MKTKGIRMTFTIDELGELYGLLGGKVGMLRDEAAIRDRRPSEIAKQLADLQLTQDRIASALRDKEGHEQ